MTMPPIRLGPSASRSLTDLAGSWGQGEHVLVSGGTGSGKSELSRRLLDVRVNAGGYVVVFFCKLLDDDTFRRSYADFDIVDRMPKWGKPGHPKLILKPKVKGMSPEQAILSQRAAFRDAIRTIHGAGRWTIQWDDALYMTDPTFMGMRAELAMMHYLGRSAGVTNITLTQRPSHIPVVTYGSVSHAFIGQTREYTDRRRLAELGATQSSKELFDIIGNLGNHDFLWIPKSTGGPPQVINLKR